MTTLFFLFLEGLLAFISPCMLPMLPIYLMYLAAETKHGRKASVVNTVGFVLGFTLIFMLLGASAAAIGALLNEHRLFLQRLIGIVIALFGLHFLGVFRIGFLDVEKKLNVEINARLPGFNFIWLCILLRLDSMSRPFLGSALMMAGGTGSSVIQGVFYLFVFSWTWHPLHIGSSILTNIKGVFQWLKKNARKIEIVSGVVLIIAGLMMALDLFVFLVEIFLKKP